MLFMHAQVQPGGMIVAAAACSPLPSSSVWTTMASLNGPSPAAENAATATVYGVNSSSPATTTTVGPRGGESAAATIVSTGSADRGTPPAAPSVVAGDTTTR